MEIKKVLNDGKNIKHVKIISFLTSQGKRTPKEIYVGYDDFGTELYGITKKELIESINRNNRVFVRHPELLEI